MRSPTTKTRPQQLASQLDDLLPQTQCTQCGYSGCKPYAQAMAQGQADINRCPPGGEATLQALASLLGIAPKPLNPDCGTYTPRHIASIQAEHCIGCTLCIQACPVDAIVGTSKHRHAVIASLCTGCELCIPPCPVDCIDMLAMPNHAQWTTEQAHAARERMHNRNQRLTRPRTASKPASTTAAPPRKPFSK
ncbi:MAG: RnfABCDGE type electron transport complex subunit B, partial [Limnobacter sp.]|nr:RnfABCDGE type electron transport complex subunit B [Limnobacter sp.]